MKTFKILLLFPFMIGLTARADECLLERATIDSSRYVVKIDQNAVAGNWSYREAVLILDSYRLAGLCSHSEALPPLDITCLGSCSNSSDCLFGCSCGSDGWCG